MSGEYQTTLDRRYKPLKSGRPGGTYKHLLIRQLKFLKPLSTDNYGSVGSMRNPMYRNTCSNGTYVKFNMRNYRRFNMRAEQKELQRQSERASKFHKGFA